MVHKGTFFVFEGPDGSGQTTQARLLAEALTESGRAVFLTKEPTLDSSVSERIKHILQKKEKTDPKTLQKLFVEDRAEHLQNSILPALARGDDVVCDRYILSTCAYGSLDCDIDWLTELNKDFRVPDCTFILRVRPEICMERIKTRGTKTELFEKTEKLQRVLDAYLRFAALHDTARIVDGERSVNEVFSDVWQHAKPFISHEDPV